MQKSVKTSLLEASDALEHLVKALPKMTREEQIDTAARLKAVAKHCEFIDDEVKKVIKNVRKGNAGFVLGEIFKAKLALVSTTRFDQKAFKEADFRTYEQYLKEDDETRITFEPR
jgi:hypothetical protein